MNVAGRLLEPAAGALLYASPAAGRRWRRSAAGCTWCAVRRASSCRPHGVSFRRWTPSTPRSRPCAQPSRARSLACRAGAGSSPARAAPIRRALARRARRPPARARCTSSPSTTACVAAAAAEAAAVVAAAPARGLDATALRVVVDGKSMAAARRARYDALVAEAAARRRVGDRRRRTPRPIRRRRCSIG